MIGSKLGPYEIIEEVGRGGMATVYRAYQPNVDRFVAIKVIHRSVSLDNKSLDRFTREARLVAKLEHPHILPVYDYNGQSDPPYIVMRYLPTGTLKDILERAQLPFPEVGYLMSQIGSALDYAHRQGVVHRDIKPLNIMVDGDGNAFLTDFGIARIVEGTEGLTASGMAIGTPGYMAHEQCLGVPIDGRADIYALGVMLFEMLAGKVPYSAETPMAIILKHINDPVPEITAANPNLPTSLNLIIQKAMAKSPDDRYSTATELARALISALGTTSDVTPSRLQAVAEQTIVDLEKERQDRAKAAPIGSNEGGYVAAPSSQGPAGTAPKANATQTMHRSAFVGAAAGIAVVLVLLLIAGGGLLALDNQNNADATATAFAQAQAQVAAQNTQVAAQKTNAAGQVLTETSRPTATFTTTPLAPPNTPLVVAPTAAATATPLRPTAEPPTAVPPTAAPPTAGPTLAPPTAVAVLPTINASTNNTSTDFAATGKLPFLDDMESSNAVDNWDYDKAQWALKTDSGNSAFVASGDFHSLAIVLSGQKPEWADPANTSLLISYSMNLEGQSSVARLIFRDSASGYYALETGLGRLALYRGKTQDASQVLNLRLVKQTASTIQNGNWFLVEVWSDSNNIFVYVDHKLALSAEDMGDTLPGGQLMLQSVNKNFRTKWDNIKVQKPVDVSQHFEGSDWPTTWNRTNLNSAKIVSDGAGNSFVDVTSGDVAPITQSLANVRMACRLWVVAGGFDMRMREHGQAQYLVPFQGGDLNLSQIDTAGKVVQKWTYPNIYGRADFFDMTVALFDRQVHIYKNGVQTDSIIVNNPPRAGNIRFTANSGDELRIDDCLFVQSSISATEQASWAFAKVTEIEARNPQTLLSEWYDGFDDQFKTKDWWVGGVDAPRVFKVASADNAHSGYLEMTYKE